MISKKFVNYLIIGALILFVLVGLNILLNKTKSPPPTYEPQLSYALQPSKTQFKVGEKISVPIFLQGPEAGKTIAFDIKVNYDKTKLKLTNALPGGFLPKYMTIKWDNEEGWYALALTPSTPKINPDPSQPVMTLEFSPLSKAGSTTVTTGVSTVYVSQTGGASPQTGMVNLTIN